MIIDALSLNSNMYSLGSILGGNSQQDLLNQINQSAGGGSFFGSMLDPMRTGYQMFMQQVVEPIRQSAIELNRIAIQLTNPNVIRPIDSIETLKQGIPPCMQLPIVYYEPIRTMLNEDRIDGFGIDPKTLQIEDPYKDMVENGKYILHSTTIKDGKVEIVFKRNTTDPKLTPEEVMDISITRDFIDRFMSDDETRHMDFTDFPSLHG